MFVCWCSRGSNKMKTLPHGSSWKCLRTISADSTGDTANDKVLTEFIPFSEPCRLERIQTLGSGFKQCIERDHFVAQAICRI